MTSLGIDIGGANLKYADSDGLTSSVEFPLWKHPERLANQLATDLRPFLHCDSVVATMTGELADCFLDRREGVGFIVDQLCIAARQCGFPDPRIYAVDGKFHSPLLAKDMVEQVAAANWHGLASYVARTIAPNGLLVDVGSTTCDIIPLEDGAVALEAATDTQRLASGALVYVGGNRTPVCTVVRNLCWCGQDIPLMREVFATMDDVRVLLGFEEADSLDRDSADGKPRDYFHCSNRLARTIGLDHRDVTIDDAKGLASEVHNSARMLIDEAMSRFPVRRTLVLSGHCSDLVTVPDGVETTELSSRLGAQVSRCAPAFAIAKLAADATTAPGCLPVTPEKPS